MRGLVAAAARALMGVAWAMHRCAVGRWTHQRAWVACWGAGERETNAGMRTGVCRMRKLCTAPGDAGTRTWACRHGAGLVLPLSGNTWQRLRLLRPLPLLLWLLVWLQLQQHLLLFLARHLLLQRLLRHLRLRHVQLGRQLLQRLLQGLLQHLLLCLLLR